MQPYRTAKPHDPAACDRCSLNGPGHRLCQGPDGCSEIATAQTRRHATQAEYDAIPEALKPRDGYATMPVFGCDDCADDGQFDPFCDHAPVPAPPCPKCAAEGDAPCTKKDRATPRTKGWHDGRTGPIIEPCHHAHREECAVFTGCQCTGDDPAPTRTPRAAGTNGPAPDISGLTVPVHIAQMVLAQAGYSWPTVTRAYSLQTQDNRPAIGADVHVYESGHLQYDQHGHPLVQNVVVPILLVPQGQLLGPGIMNRTLGGNP